MRGRYGLFVGSNQLGIVDYMNGVFYHEVAERENYVRKYEDFWSMKKRVEEVLLYGWFGENNLGDELILSSLEGLVREALPSAKISIMASKPDMLKKMKPNAHDNAVISTYIDHRPRSILRSVKYGLAATVHNLRSPDLVIMATGGALSDWNYNSTVTIFDLINYWTNKNIPIVMFGVGAGPILEKESAKRFYEHLRKIDLITVRDDYAFDQLRDIGLKNVMLTKDIVFETFDQKMIKKASEVGKVKQIGVVAAPICLETPNVYVEYRSRLTEAICRLCEKYAVSLIPFQPEYDKRLTEYILGADSRIKLLVNPDGVSQNLDNLVAQDLIIGMRYHSIVESLMNGKYVIPIVYHPKCESLCQNAGIKQYAEYVGNGNNWMESNIDTDQLIRSVEDIQQDDSYFFRIDAFCRMQRGVSVEKEYLLRYT